MIAGEYLDMSRNCRIPTLHPGPAGPKSDFYTFAPGHSSGGNCIPLGNQPGRPETGAAPPVEYEPKPPVSKGGLLLSAMKPLLVVGVLAGAVMLLSRSRG